MAILDSIPVQRGHARFYRLLIEPVLSGNIESYKDLINESIDSGSIRFYRLYKEPVHRTSTSLKKIKLVNFVRVLKNFVKTFLKQINIIINIQIQAKLLAKMC